MRIFRLYKCYLYILQHLTENNTLIDEQHGFVSNRSCLTNLLLNLEELTSIYEEGDPVDEIYLDLQKAFDSTSTSLVQTPEGWDMW